MDTVIAGILIVVVTGILVAVAWPSAQKSTPRRRDSELPDIDRDPVAEVLSALNDLDT